MFDLYSEVTLKSRCKYDRTTEITTKDIGEITDIVDDEDGRHYVVSFQELIDSEGVTPQVWAFSRDLNIHRTK